MWLASYPRSGNTWTRTFLCNIRRVTAGARGPASFNDMRRFAPWERSKGLYSDYLGQSVDTLTRERIAALRPKMQEAVAARTRGYAFFKTHSGRFMDEGVPVINPAVVGGIVYIIRNPLDVAVSFAKHMNLSIDKAITTMARSRATMPEDQDQVREIIGSWSEHVATWTTPSDRKLFVLRYEDAVAKPFEVFADLARHVGLTPDRLEVGLAVEFSSFDRLRQQERETGFAETSPRTVGHFRAATVGGWRGQLNAQQIDRILRVHGEQMQRFGYLPDSERN